MKVEGPQLIFKCLNCNKDYNKDFSKELINRFLSTYKFCIRDINKFSFLLRKGVMNMWIARKDLMKHHCLVKKIFIVA